MIRRLRCAATIAAAVILFGPAMAKAGVLFVAEAGSGDILRMNTDGSDITPILSVFDPNHLAVDPAGGKLYIAQFLGTINRANLDGSDFQVLAGPNIEPVGVAVNSAAGTLYYGDVANGTVVRSNLDGSGASAIATVPGGESTGLAVDPVHGKLYIVDSNSGAIDRANLDGTGLTPIITGFSSPIAVAVDPAAGLLFIADESGTIDVANLDGTDLHAIVTGLAGVYALTLDTADGKIFWANGLAKSVGVANYDGTGAKVIASGLSSPSGIAFLATPVPEPSSLALLCLGAAGTVAARRRAARAGAAAA